MTSSEQPGLEAKRAYFKDFDILPYSDDDDGDAGGGKLQDRDDDLGGREERRRRDHLRFFGRVSSGCVSSSVSSSGMKRSSRLGSGRGEDGGEVDERSGDKRKSGATTATKKNKNNNDNKKRRQKKDDDAAQDAGALLKDLVLYYIPDNEIAPARRLRMQKAREHGATRTRDLGAATHVVVDKSICYQDVVKVLRQEGGRAEEEGEVAVVNEDYPIECVQFRALLDWRQERYRLVGQAEAEAEAMRGERKGGTIGISEDSGGKRTGEQLELKESRRRLQSTMSGSSNGSPVAENDVESQPIVLEAVRALDAAGNDGAVGTTTTEVKNIADRDELASFIDMMQEFKDLPLDINDDEDDNTSIAGSDASASESAVRGQEEEQEMRRRKALAEASRPKSAKKQTTLEDRFACHHSGGREDNANTPNSRTVEILQRMLGYYERVGDQWRTLAYRRAIATLKRQPKHISSAEEALRLPGVGHRLAAKIEEIATTDRLRRLEYAEQDGGGEDATLKLFLGIYGVGPALAAKWVALGLRTLDDVRQREAHRLTAGQRLGIERYADLNDKMARAEVEALARVVREAATKLDPRARLTIGGSYRRGAPRCGDLDVLVSRPGTGSEAELRPLLRRLVERLEGEGVAVATLSGSGGGGGSVWQGCCVLPPTQGGQGVWRRVDLLAVPETQMGAALVYFTGDDVFNRSLRLLARRKGMRLNQRGLFRRDGGALVEGRREGRIFECLGVGWREPTERWCR